MSPNMSKQNFQQILPSSWGKSAGLCFFRIKLRAINLITLVVNDFGLVTTQTHYTLLETKIILFTLFKI